MNGVLRRLLTPSARVDSVLEISPQKLHDQGMKAALLDMDNTLVPWKGEVVDKKIADWVGQLKGAGLSCCIVSNTHRPDRLARLADTLAIGYVYGVMKPFKGGFTNALRKLGREEHEAVMIGDQLFTDILGANRLGIQSILVRPLSTVEFVGTRWISRPLERFVLSRIYLAAAGRH